MRATLAALACCAASAAALAPARARAEKGELQLQLAPGYSLLYVDERSPSGGGGLVEVGYGVHEAFSLHVEGGATWHALPATMTMPGGTVSAFSALAGVNYTLDVIRLMPSFEAAVGVVGLRSGGALGLDRATPIIKDSTALALSLGFQLDYFLTRHVSVGVVVKYLIFASDLNRIPAYLFVGPRVGLHFGGQSVVSRP